MMKSGKARKAGEPRRRRSRVARTAAALLLVLGVAALGLGSHPQAARADGPAPVPGDPLTGSGDVSRTALTYTNLTTRESPAAPVDDGAFALPPDAARPAHTFEAP